MSALFVFIGIIILVLFWKRFWAGLGTAFLLGAAAAIIAPRHVGLVAFIAFWFGFFGYSEEEKTISTTDGEKKQISTSKKQQTIHCAFCSSLVELRGEKAKANKLYQCPNCKKEFELVECLNCHLFISVAPNIPYLMCNSCGHITLTKTGYAFTQREFYANALTYIFVERIATYIELAKWLVYADEIPQESARAILLALFGYYSPEIPEAIQHLLEIKLSKPIIERNPFLLGKDILKLLKDEDDDEEVLVFYKELCTLAFNMGLQGKREKILKVIKESLNIADDFHQNIMDSLKNSASDGNFSSSKKSQKDDEIQQAYQILGCSPNASFAEVQRAYLELVRKYHPDKFASLDTPPELLELSKEKTQQLNQAFDLLKRVMQR